VGRESVEGGDEQRVCVAEHLERVDSIAGGANHGAQGRGSAVGIDYPINLSAVWEDADFFRSVSHCLGRKRGLGMVWDGMWRQEISCWSLGI
jgi:hypothetical protein